MSKTNGESATLSIDIEIDGPVHAALDGERVASGRAGQAAALFDALRQMVRQTA
jgi:hypothetical protein